MRLKSRVSLITGGNSGIGLGIAKEFQEEGAIGAILGRNPDTLNAAAQELGESFSAIRADVTDSDQLEEAFEQVALKHGKLDILVVNAGGAIGEGTLGSVADMTEASYDSMMELNLKSVFFTVQKSLPFLNDGASIILVASIAAHKAFEGMAVYAAAKAGVRSFARSFSADLLHRKIRVNVLSPGTIETPVFGKMGLPEEVISGAKKQFEELIPIKRIGLPKDMGRVAVFLASEDSSFILGEEIVADGGVLNL